MTRFTNQEFHELLHKSNQARRYFELLKAGLFCRTERDTQEWHDLYYDDKLKSILYTTYKELPDHPEHQYLIFRCYDERAQDNIWASFDFTTFVITCTGEYIHRQQSALRRQRLQSMKHPTNLSQAHFARAEK